MHTLEHLILNLVAPPVFLILTDFASRLRKIYEILNKSDSFKRNKEETF
jgi:hypothetical protein